ncbi:auxin-responsive protein SAUR15-like [Nymphaea colorata]|nr:auxin-responsive protein SAUR15-like [Nymphaea colorata]
MMEVTVRERFVKVCRTVCPPKYAKLESKEGGGQERKQEKKKKKCGGFGVAVRKGFTALYPGASRRQEAVQEDVPKGHLAVYVGEKGEQRFRFVVPVCHFNHPLFLGLLKESEEEYGFCQQGCITIPCQVSRFESVEQRIAADKFSGRLRSRSGRRRSRKRWNVQGLLGKK